MVSKTCGDILQPQPAPWLYSVSLIAVEDAVLEDAVEGMVVGLKIKKDCEKNYALNDTDLRPNCHTSRSPIWG
jgi:hypothetical protein